MATERYYLDTNALYAFYRQDMASLAKHSNYQHYRELRGGRFIRRLSSGSASVYVSDLTYLEFLGNLMRHERTQHNGRWELSPREVKRIINRLKKDIGRTARHRFQLAPPIDDVVFRYARALMMDHARRYTCELGTNDAIHIAIAKLMEPPVILVTSDGGKKRGPNSAKMKCVCDRIGLQWLDPEAPMLEGENHE